MSPNGKRDVRSEASQPGPTSRIERRAGNLMDATRRNALIEKYEVGPVRLHEALAGVPPQAMHWRPASDQWSVHEIVWHCADVEPVVSGRIRYLAVEESPTIIGLDQEAWARLPGYADLPVDVALDVVAATRAATAVLLRALPEETWSREGHHTEMGRYTPEIWLQIYAQHLHGHADQIESNVRLWRQAEGEDNVCG